jgi:peptidoglycan/LPS O-acetylase OafA/YrhL
VPVDNRYRSDIDGLRAVAIILVILFHAFPEYPSGGFVGVDVFFVISGYLISGILLEELRLGHFSLLGFYARRCRRIVPALVVVLIAVLAGGWFLLLPTEYVEAGWGILGGAAFISNVVLWYQTGYFDVTAAVKPLLHLWSLGIEEQFYVIWPLLLWAAYRWRLHLGAMIAGLFAGSFILMLQWPQTQAFYLLPSRFWELLLGGGLVYLERYHPGRMDALLSLGNKMYSTHVLPHLKGAVAVGLLGWSGIALANSSTFPSWNALPPTVATFLLISAGRRGWVNRAILSSAPAVFVGRISFPLYLWHWPLLSFAHIIAGTTPPLEARTVLVMLAVVLAWLTWVFVERPVQRWLPTSRLEARRFDAIRLVMSSLAVLAVAGGLGRVIIVHHGIASRVAEGVLGDATPPQFYAYTALMKKWTNVCEPRSADRNDWCVSNNPTRDRFALYGDSHAEMFMPSLLGSGTASDGWLFVGLAGCPPITNVNVREGDIDRHCDQTNNWVHEVLSERQDIKTVVLASLGTPYFSVSGGSGYSRDGAFRMGSTAYSGSLRDLFYQGLADSVSRLLAAHKRVILMIDTPEMDFSLGRCAVNRPLLHLLVRAKSARCGVTRAEYLKRNSQYRDMLSMIKQQHPDVLIYDPIDLFCDAEMCSVFHNGRSLYRDGDHLSVYGSMVAGGHFLEWMKQQGVPLSEEAQAYTASLPR